MMLAAAQATDAIVIGSVILGALLGIAGLASLDPRIRGRLPVAILARSNAVVAVGLILVGFVVISIALGGGE